MGIRITVGDFDYQVTDYSVSESATPLAAGDSSGSVGEFSFTLPYPDIVLSPDHPINLYGAEWLIDQSVILKSTNLYGVTLGKVDSVSTDPAMIQVVCESRLGELNVYNVQAQPYVGTLGGAFAYYLSLAGVTTGYAIDGNLTSRPVTLPGFQGELWFHLKQLAAAQDCDISLVSGVILLRPIRTRIAERGRTLQRSGESGGTQLAQAVEVYLYKSKAVTNGLVYPPGGWVPETEVLNVNAGETTEYVLELEASLSSIQEPEMRTFVSSDYNSSSVYTVVADDGLPVPPSQWADFGGRVSVELNPDTSSLTVKITGATGIPLATGGVSSSYSLALASDTSGSRYSTLRIVGTGITYSKEKKRLRTGVPPERTSTDVGLTIDNPFITDMDTLYRAGARAASAFTGVSPTINATVSSVNALGDSGAVHSLSYGQVETALFGEFSEAPTYEDVRGFYGAQGASQYGAVQNYWLAQNSEDFENQTFGNVQGARIFDPQKKRWYRIRDATITSGGVQITGDDDLNYGDVGNYFMGDTYDDIQSTREGLTYQQERTVGLRGA